MIELKGVTKRTMPNSKSTSTCCLKSALMHSFCIYLSNFVIKSYPCFLFIFIINEMTETYYFQYVNIYQITYEKFLLKHVFVFFMGWNKNNYKWPNCVQLSLFFFALPSITNSAQWYRDGDDGGGR